MASSPTKWRPADLAQIYIVVVKLCRHSELKDNQVIIRECGVREMESVEGSLDNNQSSSEKTPEPAAGKKKYTTPSLRYESVFEVSALACGKLSSTQSGCRSSRKAS
jgi:hypothetical protein